MRNKQKKIASEMASNDNDLTICADSCRVLAYKLKMSKISLIADIFNDDTKEKKFILSYCSRSMGNLSFYVPPIGANCKDLFRLASNRQWFPIKFVR